MKTVAFVFVSALSTGITVSDSYALTACGDLNQRGCCVASTERLASGACKTFVNGDGDNDRLAEIPGCGGDCRCGGSGLAPFFGFSSSSHCEAVSPCGGEGERACCIIEPRFNNPIPLSDGCETNAGDPILNLTEVAGGVGQGQLCGGANPFGIRSNGTCVVCGTEGAHACVGVALEEECKAGLTKDLFGFCTSCGAEGQPVCNPGQLCNPGLHPVLFSGGDLQECLADRVIEEPDCGRRSAVEPTDPGEPVEYVVDCTASPQLAAPVVGYADLHLHMFSNLGFGGLLLWGDSFDPRGGVSQALRADNFAQRTADRVLNLRMIQGRTLGPVLPIVAGHFDGLRGQTLVHGDNHINDLIGAGTDQHFPGALANGGVQWDPNLSGDVIFTDFNGWPNWDSTTHQQAYYKWLQRAHLGGLRLVTMMAVTNEALCAAGARFVDPEFDCTNSMGAIDLQIDKAFELQAYLDEQCALHEAGETTDAFGRAVDPSACDGDAATAGAGWFRVVKTPLEAREAIARGQLAVVLGIEVDNLFGCFDADRQPFACTRESVRAAVEKYRDRGVTHVFPIHNFDNGFGGAATWLNDIHIGNRYATNHWYAATECPTPTGTTGYGFKLDGSEGFFSKIALGLDTLVIPVYPGLQTTCNARGLTDLGRFLMVELMSQGMILDIDHMSIRSLDATLDLAEAHAYPGIVASHALMFDLTEKSIRHERMRTKEQLQRIASLGGMIAAMTQPPAGGILPPPGGSTVIGSNATGNDCPKSSKTWAQMYEYAIDTMGPALPEDTTLGVAFGTDFNGISQHNAPRFGSQGCTGQTNPVSYPFDHGFGLFDRQVTGGRIFDFNSDGLAHVGLLPDMVEDLIMVGLSDLDPLFQSAEAYIQMWERVSAAAPPPPSLVDNEPPQTTAVVSPPGNATGWHNENATVDLTAEDLPLAGSGVAAIFMSTKELGVLVDQTIVNGAVAQTTVTAEGESIIEFAARDLDGNVETLNQLAVKLDKTPPSITGVRDELGPFNAAGWYRDPVTVSFSCADGPSPPQSGLAACSAGITLGEGADQSVAGEARDVADNVAEAIVANINIDQTPPETASVVDPTTPSGWTNALSVGVTLSATDPNDPSGQPLSGVAGIAVAASGADVIAESLVAGNEAGLLVVNEGTTTVSYSAIDVADNPELTKNLQVKIDRTPPIIVGARSPIANLDGWNNEDVTVSFACVDPGDTSVSSGIAICQAPLVLSAEGAGQNVTGTGTDFAGNESAPITVGPISIDKTAPQVEIVGVIDGQIFDLGVPVPVPDCVETDDLSGMKMPASLSISETDSKPNGIGDFTITCSGAKDVADNMADAVSIGYSIHYVFSGFFNPIANQPTVNSVKAGQSIPVKFSLSGDQGLDILAAGSPTSVQVACGTGAPINELAEATETAGGSSLTYDATEDQYKYMWKTEKAWKGSCRRLTMRLDDETDHQVEFSFK